MKLTASKTKLMATALGALMLLSAAGSAFAHSGERYGRGCDGGLNRHERKVAWENKKDQRRYYHRAMRDGHLNRDERRNLARMDRYNQRYISQSRHDRW